MVHAIVIVLSIVILPNKDLTQSSSGVEVPIIQINQYIRHSIFRRHQVLKCKYKLTRPLAGQMIKAHLLCVPGNDDIVFDVYFETFDLRIGSLLNRSGLWRYGHFFYRSTVLQLDRDMSTLLINLSGQ